MFGVSRAPLFHSGCEADTNADDTSQLSDASRTSSLEAERYALPPSSTLIFQMPTHIPRCPAEPLPSADRERPDCASLHPRSRSCQRPRCQVRRGRRGMDRARARTAAIEQERGEGCCISGNESSGEPTISNLNYDAALFGIFLTKCNDAECTCLDMVHW